MEVIISENKEKFFRDIGNRTVDVDLFFEGIASVVMYYRFYIDRKNITFSKSLWHPDELGQTFTWERYKNYVETFYDEKEAIMIVTEIPDTLFEMLASDDPISNQMACKIIINEFKLKVKKYVNKK